MTATDRMEYSRKPKTCPNCGHRQVARILYGLPRLDVRLEQQLQAGTITLGGCCVSDDDPVWECLDCGQQVHRRKSV